MNLGAKSTVIFKGKRAVALTGSKRPKWERTTLTFKSVNSQLQGVLQVLKFETSRQPGVLGASVFGYNDAYCRLQPFIRKWKAALGTATASGAASVGNGASAAGSARGAAPPRPYIVAVDVSRAFDHVDVATLLHLVEGLLQCEEYLVLKYSEVVPCLGDVKVLPRRLAIPAHQADAPDFPRRAAEWAKVQKSKVFVDGVVYEKVSRSGALSLMRQHLTANLVRLRRQWHYQCRGIAQGGTLSTLLCCLYLGHVERLHLEPIIASCGAVDRTVPPPVPSNRSGPTPATAGTTSAGLTALAAALGTGSPASNARRHSSTTAPSPATRSLRAPVAGAGACPSSTHSVLLRLVDDWLLVTLHEHVAAAFAGALLGGIPSFNVVVNPDKTKVSFPLRMAPGIAGTAAESGAGDVREVPPSLFVSGDGARFIKWCGLLVNSDSLEIQGDYTRYAGEHISTSLTMPLRKSPGAALGQKLCHYLRPKVHPLLLDPGINSARTVRLNVYQAFILGAMKFHCYVDALPATPASDTRVLMDAIELGINFMCKLTRPKHVASLHRPGTTIACDAQLSPAHVRYLGLHAFRTVLARKQAVYKALLAKVDEALKAPCCARCAKALAAVVDPRLSSVFDAILY